MFVRVYASHSIFATVQDSNATQDGIVVNPDSYSQCQWFFPISVRFQAVGIY